MSWCFSLYAAQQHRCRHTREHAARDGKVIDPRGVLLFGEPYKHRHHRRRHRNDRKRHPASRKRKPSRAGDESADVAADVRADKTDEHGGHGRVAEAAARRAVFLRRFETREVFLIKEDRKHHAPHDADAHQKGDRGKSLRRHCRGRKARQTDCLRRGLRDLRFIVQRADDRKAQPRPRRAETARERDDAKQDADARERGKRGARGDGALHFRFVHTDGGAGAVGAYHEEHAHQRNKENNAAADEIHDRTVELR